MPADSSPAYDLAPLAALMLVGVLLALGPLAWVLWRNRGGSSVRRLRALTVLTLFLTFDLVLFGAFTRLTDSGLGCPDWPGCYGNASPLGAHAEITAAQTALPSGPVTHRKAWIEMVHRYLAGGVGVLIMVIALLAWRGHWRARRVRQAQAAQSQARSGRGLPAPPVATGATAAAGAPPALSVPGPWWPTLTLFWVCLQGAFGAWTVTMKLFPAIVTLHLAGGLVLLALLCAQAVRLQHAERGTLPVTVPRSLRWWTGAALALVAVQVLLGGWVSTNYAVLACTTFPTCQGQWWPDIALAEGFQIWRPLGVLQDGSHISFAGLTAIHVVHRAFAGVVFGVLGVLAWRLVRDGRLARQGRWIAGLALWQFATGLSNVVLDWPLVAAVSHTGGAAALVVVLAWAWSASRGAAAARAASAPARTDDGAPPPRARTEPAT